MVSLTFNLDDDTFKKISKYSWVNWSEIAREETTKKEIFERYLKTKEITDEDFKFCESIDWHPVDELPIKKEYLEKLKKIKKEKAIKINSVSGLFE